MKTTKVTKGAPVRSRVRVELSPGQAVRVGRELQELTQADLASLCDIPQSTISAIESGRVKLGAERAERLARALRVHPAVLLWPNWVESEPTALGRAAGVK
jgi:transcriptional regulator with XRE-family HTH domain